MLEAAWVYKAFRNESFDLDSLVISFYRDFYGYDVEGRLSTILEGMVS